MPSQPDTTRTVTDVQLRSVSIDLVGAPGTSVQARPERADREGDTQAMPVASDSPVMHKLVQDDLEARLQVGIKRYGQPLQARNGRDALVDLYEELLDACVYIKQAIWERDNPL